MIWLAAFLAIALAAPAAGAPPFALPIDCQPGTDCFVQNHVDHDPGPGAIDFTCGRLTYDGHKGTDFALPDLAAAHATHVLAPAAGNVLRVRDGVPDRDPDSDLASDGAECGNGLILDHGDGWESQLCHLATGSLRIRQGQLVTRGQTLGRVGLSGHTEFPHLHFTLRHDGRIIDPFATNATACGKGGGQLWAQPLPYYQSGAVSAGFATAIPTLNQVILGTAAAAFIEPAAPALVAWASFYGLRTGDLIRIVIDGPEGRFLEHQSRITRNRARAMRAVGRRRDAAPWHHGQYRATAWLIRDGSMLAEIAAAIRVE